ncbi:Cytochrome p450, partial [Thalictrum thalictroides]
MWFLAVMFVIVWMTKLVYRWTNPRCNGKLPPGSMGLPLLGESFQFFKPVSSFDIHPFIKDRVKRYGKIFKTSLVGCPVIVSTDPDFSHFIFQQEGNSLELWYSDSFMKLIGQHKLTTSTGTIHKYLRNMIMDQFGPEKQKEKVLLEIEDMALLFASFETVALAITLAINFISDHSSVLEDLK